MDDEIRAAANRLLYLCLQKGQRAVIVRADDQALWVHCHEEGDVHWMCKAVVDAHEVPKDRSVN
jgi:hypothetical protein